MNNNNQYEKLINISNLAINDKKIFFNNIIIWNIYYIRLFHYYCIIKS